MDYIPLIIFLAVVVTAIYFVRRYKRNKAFLKDYPPVTGGTRPRDRPSDTDHFRP